MNNNMTKTIETAYSPEHDITFILEHLEDSAGEPVQTSVCGWYYGEPNEEDTNAFFGKLIARY